MIERRSQPFVLDEAKFGTQKVVTYILLALFAGCAGIVFLQLPSDQSERSTVLQTIINLTFLAAGFWLGSSKGAADNRDQLNKMLAPTQTGSTTISTVSDEPKPNPPTGPLV